MERLHKHARLYENVAIMWDEKKKKMKHLGPDIDTKTRIMANLNILGAVIILGQILHYELQNSREVKDRDTFAKLLRAYAIIALPMTIVFLSVCTEKSEEMAMYFNGLFELAPGHKTMRQNTDLKTQQHSLKTLNILFAWILYTSLFVTPSVLVIGFHWSNPCKSTLLAWWALPECFHIIEDRNICIDWLTKTVILFGNHYIWSKGFSALLYILGALRTIGMIKLNEHINKYTFNYKLESRKIL
ncbi:unnamed protein product [Orchesella dallaii]|uniref:Uncharacterized protein n=1 Tax=Orchesella dallaii TaxID=48710 RepID=A0ABP1RN73_9HEXA